MIFPLLAHKLKLFAHRHVDGIPLLVSRGVAHRVAAAAGILYLLLAFSLHLVPHADEGSQAFRIFGVLLPLLLPVPLLHGLHVLRTRLLDLRHNLRVLLLQLLHLLLHGVLCLRFQQLHLVLLGAKHGGEPLHAGHVGG